MTSHFRGGNQLKKGLKRCVHDKNQKKVCPFKGFIFAEHQDTNKEEAQHEKRHKAQNLTPEGNDIPV